MRKPLFIAAVLTVQAVVPEKEDLVRTHFVRAERIYFSIGNIRFVERDKFFRSRIADIYLAVLAVYRIALDGDQTLDEKLRIAEIVLLPR